MGTLNGVAMNSTSKPNPELARQFLQAVRAWLIEQQQGLDTQSALCLDKVSTSSTGQREQQVTA